MNYFLIPGNPPAVHFYELWGNEIQAQNLKAKVKVSHYPDLEFSNDSNKSMGDVLDAHYEQLKAFHADTKGPVTIAGHSLGGYFALELLSKAPDLIDKAILLHPFLRRPSPLGLVTLKLAGALCGSDRFHNAFLGVRKKLELLFGDLAHVTNEEVLRALQLARHESRTIGRDRTNVVIDPNLRNRVHIFFNQNDNWCTRKVVNELKQQVVVKQCSEPHGFITSKRHRRNLFARIVTG